MKFWSQGTDIDLLIQGIIHKYLNASVRIVLCHKNDYDAVKNLFKDELDDLVIINDNEYCITKPFNISQLKEMILFFGLQFFTIIFKKEQVLQVENLDSKKIKDAFISDLKGQVSNLSELKEAVKCISEQNNDKIFVRSMHLVQSSGHGKTKHGIELIKDCGQGLYFVSRESKSSGFPGQPQWVTNLMAMINDSDSPINCELYWLQMIKAALESFNYEKMQGIDLVQMFSGVNHRDLMNAFAAQFNSLSCSSISDIENDILTLGVKLEIDSGKMLFPIIFDEATALLQTPNPDSIEYYRSLRRALSRLVGCKGLVAIFMGTSSFIKDYSFFFKDDSTRKALKRLGEKEKLFVARPFVLAHSMDVFNEVILLDYDLIVKTPAEFQNNLIHFGRPLWSGYGNWEDAKSLARTKLEMFGAHDAPLNALLVRICASVSPQGSFSNRLVQSGMATLLYVDENGEDCYSTYVAEPVLSGAARELLSNISRFQTSIELLTSYVGRGFFQKGQAGELIARIILLLAMDKGGGSYKKLKDFLADFAGAEISNELDGKYSNDLLDGLLSFSQFISMDTLGFAENDVKFRVTQDLLKEAFVRNVALILPIGTKGADMIIPVLKPDNTMSCVAIQIKNLKYLDLISGQELKSVLEKLSPSYLGFLDLSSPISLSPPSTPIVVEEPVVLSLSYHSRVTRSKTSAVSSSPVDYVPLMIQFSPPLSSEMKNELVDVSIQKLKDMNYICILGLSAFNHLLSNFDVSVKNNLQSLINGEFHFMNHIGDDPKNFIPAQSSKIAFESRLFTTNPVANKAYLAYSNENYREKNEKEAELVDEKMKVAGIKRRGSSGRITIVPKSTMRMEQ